MKYIKITLLVMLSFFLLFAGCANFNKDEVKTDKAEVNVSTENTSQQQPSPGEETVSKPLTEDTHLSQLIADKAFINDPSYVVEMPAEWVEREIKYKAEVGQPDLVIDLNQQLHPLLLPVVQKYAQENDLEIEVSGGTCGTTGGMLSEKEADMGSFCCPPGEIDRLPGLRFHTLGIRPLVLIVHPENPVDDITVNQVRQIYQGKINNWSELGGKDIPITTMAALHCKSRPGHWCLILPDEEFFNPTLLEVAPFDDSVIPVVDNPQAFSYETLHTVNRFIEEEKGNVKVLKIDGLHPKDLEYLVSGEYPFYVTFTITTWSGEHIENPHAQKLVAYLQQELTHLDTDAQAFVPASVLRENGWVFQDDELIGESE